MFYSVTLAFAIQSNCSERCLTEHYQFHNDSQCIGTFDSALDGICVVNKFQMSSLPLFTTLAAQTKVNQDNAWNDDCSQIHTAKVFWKFQTNDWNSIRVFWFCVKAISFWDLSWFLPSKLVGECINSVTPSTVEGKRENDGIVRSMHVLRKTKRKITLSFFGDS